jgi:competence protein ComEA
VGEQARVAQRVRALVVGGSSEPAGDGPAPSLLARLAARRPVRIDPGRRGALAIGVAALVVALLTGAWVLRSRPQSLPVAVRSPFSSAPAAPASSPQPAHAGASAGGAPSVPALSSAAPILVVDVAGKVRHPGLYRLPAGARVADAITAAGGVPRGVDTTSLNLAARVADGQQIVVGATGASMLNGSGAGPSGGAAGGPVSLNSASVDELQTLPGVGPVLAQHIVDWRSAHGGFRSVAQLNDVPGIGEVKFAALKALVTL